MDEEEEKEEEEEDGVAVSEVVEPVAEVEAWVTDVVAVPWVTESPSVAELPRLLSSPE